MPFSGGEIKAIPTTYNNLKFRSKLEARWAVFFDTLGIKWEYEPATFDLGNPLGYYMPDFWIPELRYWIEIKGQEPTEEELKKLAMLASEKVTEDGSFTKCYLFHGPFKVNNGQVDYTGEGAIECGNRAGRCSEFIELIKIAVDKYGSDNLPETAIPEAAKVLNTSTRFYDTIDRHQWFKCPDCNRISMTQDRLNYCPSCEKPPYPAHRDITHAAITAMNYQFWTPKQSANDGYSVYNSDRKQQFRVDMSWRKPKQIAPVIIGQRTQ